MRHAKTHHRRSRFAFAAGALLLLPPIAGLVPRAVGLDEPKAEAPQPADAPKDEAGRQSAKLQRAVDRLRWSERMFAKGYVSEDQLEAERDHLRKLRAEAEPKDVQRAVARVLWSEKMAKKGYVSEAQLEAERDHLREVRARSQPAKAPE